MVLFCTVLLSAPGSRRTPSTWLTGTKRSSDTTTPPWTPEEESSESVWLLSEMMLPPLSGLAPLVLPMTLPLLSPSSS